MATVQATKTRKEQAAAVFLKVEASAAVRKDATIKRQATIAAFKEKIGMSDGGASTYYANFVNGTWDAKAVVEAGKKKSAAQRRSSATKH